MAMTMCALRLCQMTAMGLSCWSSTRPMIMISRNLVYTCLYYQIDSHLIHLFRGGCHFSTGKALPPAKKKTSTNKQPDQQFQLMLAKQRVISKLRHCRPIKTDPIEQSASLLPHIHQQTSPASPPTRSLHDHESAAKQAQQKWIVKNKFIDQHRVSRGYSHAEYSQSSMLSQMAIPKESPKSKPKAFFTNVSISSESPDVYERSGRQEETKQVIQKSRQFISIIKNQRKRLTKLNIQSVDVSKRDPLNLGSNDHRSGQIFSYLSRDFVVSKDQQINDEVVERYVSRSPPSKLQSINDQSREFLLKKMHSDYGAHSEVHKFRKDRIRSLIVEEIDRKKQDFKKDYKQRYNIPYFSFLTLSKQEKKSVLTRQARKSLV